ncbi:mitochondrial inner membrane protease subunit 1 isoform X2 [Entelurus aequoreus]|uniref:mitochondrial inner membrane protease subunit 1 isoform X2 n=1 Tax=Entelurus aequoreus TaxID=161455 RepID=UPI002B1CEECB|nr:mitochondrial inner membrane protease subunit 1 isoform X2 [Entelurus aequoreus]
MFRRVLGKTLGFVGYTIQYGCIGHCAFEYIGEIVVCSGPSMEPTIVNKDVIFLDRMSRHLCKIQKGDIVVAKSLFDPNMNICKRVIALEGDKVSTSGPSDLFKTHTFTSQLLFDHVCFSERQRERMGERGEKRDTPGS